MSDTQFLLLTLIVIYLLECGLWVRREALVFRTWTGRRWKRVHPPTMLGNAGGAFVPGAPLPPLGTLYQCQQWPLSVDRERIMACVAQSIHPEGRPEQTGICVRLDAIETIGRVGRSVVVDDVELVRVSTELLADHLVDFIRELAEAEPDEREARIVAELERAQDTDAVRAAIASHRGATRWLRLWCNLLFVVLLVATPVTSQVVGFAKTWLFSFAALLVLNVATIMAFVRAHRKIKPAQRRDRWARVAVMALCPPATVRGRDLLLSDTLSTYHPWALARVVLTGEELRSFGARLLRDLHHPMAALCLEPGAELATLEQRSRERLRDQVTASVRDAGIDADALLAPPEPDAPECRSFCPRCRSQFVHLDWGCPECDLPATPFAAGPKAVPAPES